MVEGVNLLFQCLHILLFLFQKAPCQLSSSSPPLPSPRLYLAIRLPVANTQCSSVISYYIDMCGPGRTPSSDLFCRNYNLLFLSDQYLSPYVMLKTITEHFPEWFFHFSNPNLRSYIVLPVEAFVCTYRFDLFCTNDEWRHCTHRVARNCPGLCSFVYLSFWSKWLPLFIGFFWLARYRWFSLPPRCDFSVIA